jgi:hypothetical protein
MPRAFIGAGKVLIATFLPIVILISLTAGSQASGILDGYKPDHSQGSGENDWWIGYPAESDKAGTYVAHPSWVLDALKEKPVLILDHSSNCNSCTVQKANIDNVLAIYGNNVTYYDIMADERDQRAFDILDVYGLTGFYVPTTVFLTLQKGPDGKVTVAWHSAEDAMSENDIASYIKDAIYYYQQNAATWSK